MEIEGNIFLYQDSKYENCKGCLQIIVPTITPEDIFKLSMLEYYLSEYLYSKGYEIIGLYLRTQTQNRAILQVVSYNVEILSKLNIPLDDYQLYGQQYLKYMNIYDKENIHNFNSDLVIYLKEKMKGEFL